LVASWGPREPPALWERRHTDSAWNCLTQLPPSGPVAAALLVRHLTYAVNSTAHASLSLDLVLRMPSFRSSHLGVRGMGAAVRGGWLLPHRGGYQASNRPGYQN